MTSKDYQQKYNTMKRKQSQTVTEQIRLLKESNPQRYAELLAMAQRGESLPSQPVTPSTSLHTPDTLERRIQKVCRTLYNPNKADYNVVIRDSYGSERRLFISLGHNPTVEECTDAVNARYTHYSPVTVVSFNRCPCSACEARTSKDPKQLSQLYGPNYHEIFNAMEVIV